MNRRYMDFVPAKGKKVEPKTVQPRPVKKPVRTVSNPSMVMKEKSGSRNVVPAMVKKPAVTAVPKRSVREDGRLGVIEDLGVGGSVPIEPRAVETRKNEIRELKAKKVGVKEERTIKTAEKASGLKTKAEDTFKTPRAQFINQDKVVKRPLSKNVYRKEPVVAKEEPKGPVTIITKPEKQAHISLIVTIIITIILGAAAGTVAFLLLPK